MSTPAALAKTSQNRLCHTANANTLGRVTPAAAAPVCSFPDATVMTPDAWIAVTSDRRGLLNPPVPHFNQAVAALGESTVMRCHHQGDALGGNQIEQ